MQENARKCEKVQKNAKKCKKTRRQESEVSIQKVVTEIGISGYQVARCVERSATSRRTGHQDCSSRWMIGCS